MAAAVIFFAGIHAATALSLIAWRQRHRRGARL
jgi:hypothetical protein